WRYQMNKLTLGSLFDGSGGFPQSRPPNGNPPEPSNRLPRVNFLIWYLHLFYKVGVHHLFSVSLHKNILWRDAVLHGPAEDDRSIFLIQFHHAAHSVHLLADHHGGAAAAKSVDHYSVLLGGVPDR